MKSMLKAVGVAGMLLVGAVAGVQAQQANRVVKFQTPFAFQVEKDQLPAGEYTLLLEGGWMQIQAKDGTTKAKVLTMPTNKKGNATSETSEVVFHRYGTKFFLATVWATGQQTGREVLESRGEIETAKTEKMVSVRVPVNSGAAR